jgi:virginiamycin A acetyltransferase
MKKRIVLFIYLLLRKRTIRNLFSKIISKIEGGEMYSNSLREIYKKFHGIDVGLYSYGCFYNDGIRPGVKIGRYCSISKGVSIMDANHPLSNKSTHPYFYESQYGIIKKSHINHIPKEIGNDVWLGKNSIIVPSVRRIGNGAVVAAGAVVTKDVPNYAIVGGNPARIIKYRFDKKVIEKLEKEKWWLDDINNIKKNINDFVDFNQ